MPWASSTLTRNARKFSGSTARPGQRRDACGAPELRCTNRLEIVGQPDIVSGFVRDCCSLPTANSSRPMVRRAAAAACLCMFRGPQRLLADPHISVDKIEALGSHQGRCSVFELCSMTFHDIRSSTRTWRTPPYPPLSPSTGPAHL
jgi:hypothetical protein